jgi:hypothetical protein
VKIDILNKKIQTLSEGFFLSHRRSSGSHTEGALVEWKMDWAKIQKQTYLQESFQFDGLKLYVFIVVSCTTSLLCSLLGHYGSILTVILMKAEDAFLFIWPTRRGHLLSSKVQYVAHCSSVCFYFFLFFLYSFYVECFCLTDRMGTNMSKNYHTTSKLSTMMNPRISDRVTSPFRCILIVVAVL